MQSSPEAVAARERLDAVEVVAIQLYGLTQAVRALLGTHPEPDRARTVFDQLLGQMLAHPAFLGETDKAIVLKDFSATLFQPPVSLDT